MKGTEGKKRAVGTRKERISARLEQAQEAAWLDWWARAYKDDVSHLQRALARAKAKEKL